MNGAWATLTAGFVLALLVAAYTLGEWRGRRAAVDELWDTAMALGAYGQLIRMQADVEGVTVPEILARERRSGE